ncbi:LacI family DNA-binding transcriptional regulator [Rhizohabitans arisaemae]|uniref:LacI family DNA-binding transcriptional regulator n=1 Tax=Rhizohabitans arisaemae TaxID=2720610 RepID=UPI0024B0433A|nr:LacI family DNA-binding transcriptional regulator [Rhizohabitans arisaemae]
MPQPRKRATIREVAKATGLSPAAVSYALRGMQVSEETMERVRQAAAELGYEADPIARALASGRTGMIGLLCGSLEDLWQQSLAVGIGRELLDRDRYALILDAGGDPAREILLAQRLRDQRVDGLIVQPLDPSAALWRDLAQALPVVSVGDSLDAGATVGEVVFDNQLGVALSLDHLHELGHRRLAVLTPTRPGTPDRPADRYVLAAAERLGLDVALCTSPQALGEATSVARRVLAGPSRPTAVFCLSDSIAYGVYAAAAELGLAVPGDVSVMGYDDHPMSGLLSPALTTVDWDIAGIVRTAVELVLAAADGEPRARRTVQVPSLRRRGSTAHPAR